MRTFHYSALKDEKWDSEILGLVSAIYRYEIQLEGIGRATKYKRLK